MRAPIPLGEAVALLAGSAAAVVAAGLVTELWEANAWPLRLTVTMSVFLLVMQVAAWWPIGRMRGTSVARGKLAAAGVVVVGLAIGEGIVTLLNR